MRNRGGGGRPAPRNRILIDFYFSTWTKFLLKLRPRIFNGKVPSPWMVPQRSVGMSGEVLLQTLHLTVRNICISAKMLKVLVPSHPHPLVQVPSEKLKHCNVCFIEAETSALKSRHFTGGSSSS